MPIERTENEIRARLRNPGEFQPDSFRIITIDEERGIKAAIARLKGETTTTRQAIRFDIDKGWTVDKAREWLKEHGLRVIWYEEINWFSVF